MLRLFIVQLVFGFKKDWRSALLEVTMFLKSRDGLRSTMPGSQSQLQDVPAMFLCVCVPIYIQRVPQS